MNGSDLDCFANVQHLYAVWALYASCYGASHPDAVAARVAYVAAYAMVQA